MRLWGGARMQAPDLALVVMSLCFVIGWAAYFTGLQRGLDVARDVEVTALRAQAALAQCTEAAQLSLDYIRAYDSRLAAEIARRRRLLPRAMVEIEP